MPATRYLYLARHAHADPETGDLTPEGWSQAEQLGRRLRALKPDTLHHGPLPRASQTARTVAEHLPGVLSQSVPEAGDYVPHVPTRAELPDEYADRVLAFLEGRPASELDAGPDLARRALDRFTGPTDDTDTHDVVITHAYLVAWVASLALGTPSWKWVDLAPANAALTVIRYSPRRFPTVLTYNEVSHLDPDLRWTGFPDELQI
ncbi:histidine phosphatase family protein [Nocardiopsis sp. CNT312]|uniref:histidine phosphatase family protein n=1 Tax=Nocardiopsis sp. CNT312 TaxID=1137268 RepID=UPI00048F7363|nr:histidine phosphatase family protein [Nocardiopsis sp. CNT312]